MKHYEAPEKEKYWGGYDPSDPPQGTDWCSKCGNWNEDCVCEEEEESGEP